MPVREAIEPATALQTRWSMEWSVPTGLRAALYMLAVSLLAIGWKGGFPLDDAYITMHNARAVLQGWDTTYDVSPLVGATSLAHLALMAGLSLIMPLPYAALAISLAGAAAYAIGLDILVRRAGATGWKIPVLTLSGLLVGTAPILMANGLETSLACATVTWLLLLRRPLPLLAGVAPFVRPELAILSAITLVATLRNAPWSRRVIAAAIAATVALPFVLWSYAETGQFIPSTMAAKLAFFRESDWPLSQRILALAGTLWASGFLVLIPGLAGLRDWRAWTFLVTVIAFLLMLLPGAFSWNNARYLGPMVPIFILGFAQASRNRSMAFLILLLGLSVLISAPIRVAELMAMRARNEAQVSAMTASLGALPSGSRILVHDAGMPAWIGPQMHLIDVVGLKTPSSIAAHASMTRKACHWDRALDRIAQANHAQFAVVLEVPFWNCVRSNLESRRWKFTALSHKGDEYQLYAISKKE